MVDYNQFVSDLYRKELGRDDAAITQDELDAWVNALSSGGLSQQQVADMIERSPEGVAYDVNRIYGKELIRSPDEAGAKAWGDALASGAISDDEFLNQVRQSSEYGTASLGLYRDLLNNTYQKEVGRDLDEAGAAKWAAALRSGAVTADQLPSLFSNTNEGWLYDQYGNLFNRKLDPAAYAWVDALEKGTLTRDQVMAQLMSSPEYQKTNPGKAGAIPIFGAAPGSPSYVSAYQNYAPMKPLADPRSQPFGFLYDSIQQRLGRDIAPKGLLDVASINAGFSGRPSNNAAAPSPVNWAGGALQQTAASTGGYAGGGTSTGNQFAYQNVAPGPTNETYNQWANNPNLVSGLLDARNLVSGTYQSILNRAPDDVGLNNWTQAVLGGMTAQQLQDAFRASSEYQALQSASNAETPTASYDVGGGGR